MREKVQWVSQNYKSRCGIHGTKTEGNEVRAVKEQEKDLGNITQIKTPIENLENKVEGISQI